MTCKKISYPNRKNATMAIDSMARSPRHITATRPYRCKYCQTWHVTHKSKREFKNTKKRHQALAAENMERGAHEN